MKVRYKIIIDKIIGYCMLPFNYPKISLSVLLILTILFSLFLPRVKFNYNIESFFSTENKELALYQEHKKTFENENDFVLIGIKNNEKVFNTDFVIKLDSLTSKLNRINHVKKVLSPTNLNEFVYDEFFGGYLIPVIHTDDSTQLSDDEKKVYTSGIYVNSFFSTDKKSISILVKKKDGLTQKQNDSLLQELKLLLASFQFDEYHLAGRIHTQNYYINQMQSEMSIFSLLALLLFVITFLLIFRSIKYVLLSLLVVTISLVWIFGIMGLLNIHLDLMLTLIPTLVFVLGTSVCIHFLTRFQYYINKGDENKKAIEIALKETAPPNFLNAFTTTIGFASLVFVPVDPIQRFGLIAATSILICFFIGVLVLPIMVEIFAHKKRKQNSNELNNRFTRLVIYVVVHKQIAVLISFTLLIGTTFFYATKVRVNNHFLDDLNSESSLKNDLNFFENNFSGIRPFELDIQSKDTTKSLLSYEALKEMNNVEEFLKNEYKVGFISSPVFFIKIINKALNHGDNSFFKFPETKEEFIQVIRFAKKQKIWQRYLPVMSPDFSRARISGRTKDVGSIILKTKNENLIQFISSHTKLLTYQITGSAHLMDNANSNISWNMAVGIFLAVFVSTLAIWLFFGSFHLALLSIVPNIIPLVFIVGIMGFLGIPFKVSTSLLFSILYGIAVDDTIHFLSAHKKYLQDHSKSTAIHLAVSKMVSPMVFTSVVLISGFMIFLQSSFTSIFNFGLLISAGLVIALLSDLMLMPVVLLKFYKR